MAEPVAIDRSRTERSAVRVGVLYSAPRVQAWQKAALTEALSLEGVELAANFMVSTPSHPQENDGFIRRQVDQFPYLLYRLYRRAFINRLPSVASVGVEGIADDGFQVLEAVRKGRNRTEISAQALKTIADNDVDVLINYADDIFSGDVLTVCPFGIWSFHHGSMDGFRGQPSGFWEVAKGVPTTGVTLQRLTETLDGGETICFGRLQTRKTFGRNLDQALNYSANMLKRGLRVLGQRRRDGQAFEGLDVGAPEPAGDIRFRPRNFDMLKYLWKAATNIVRTIWGYKVFIEQWNVGVVSGVGDPQVDAWDSLEHGRIRWFPTPPVGDFYADPFGRLQGEEHIKILFEDFRVCAGRGCISTATIPVSSQGDTVPLAIEPWFSDAASHLSYPFLFQDHDRHYCLLESSEGGEQIVCETTPQLQAPASTVDLNMPTGYRDPTLFRHDNRVWMFASTAGDNALHLFHASSVHGPWTAHPKNPVVMDVTCARPAGPLTVTEQGRILRPGQDCSKTYGCAIVLKEITKLTPDDYAERFVKRLAPFPGRWDQGFHTLHYVGNGHALVDGKRMVFHPLILAKKYLLCKNRPKT